MEQDWVMVGKSKKHHKHPEREKESSCGEVNRVDRCTGAKSKGTSSPSQHAVASNVVHESAVPLKPIKISLEAADSAPVEAAVDAKDISMPLGDLPEPVHVHQEDSGRSSPSPDPLTMTLPRNNQKAQAKYAEKSGRAEDPTDDVDGSSPADASSSAGSDQGGSAVGNLSTELSLRAPGPESPPAAVPPPLKQVETSSNMPEAVPSRKNNGEIRVSLSLAAGDVLLTFRSAPLLTTEHWNTLPSPPDHLAAKEPLHWIRQAQHAAERQIPRAKSSFRSE
eukprot:754191-Hanusia_phi.AAC.12